MRTLLTSVLVFSLFLTLPANAVTNWTGDGDGESWMDSLNWDAGLSTIDDDAKINLGSSSVFINDGDDAMASVFTIGEFWAPAQLTVKQGGTFANNWMVVTGIGNVVVEGTLNTGGIQIVGTSRVDVKAGGVLQTSGWWQLGNDSRLTVSGSVNVNNPVDMITYMVNEIWATPTSYVDILEGQMTFVGDQRATLQAGEANGWIKAYDGTGILNYEYADGITTVTAAVPEPATIMLLSLGSFMFARRKK